MRLALLLPLLALASSCSKEQSAKEPAPAPTSAPASPTAPEPTSVPAPTGAPATASAPEPSAEAPKPRPSASPAPAASCQKDADCRAFSDYCTGCDCRALSVTDPDPKCDGPGVRCFADPCLNVKVACDNGRCVARRSAPSK